MMQSEAKSRPPGARGDDRQTASDTAPSASLDRATEEMPNPQRWRYMRRSLVFAVALLSLMGFTRWLWGVRVERQLAAYVAATRARGKPALPEDFLTPSSNVARLPSPDLYAQAMAATVYTTADNQWDRVSNWEASLTDADVAAMQTIASENLAARALVRQARKTQRLFPTSFGMLSSARSLARIVNLSALAEHDTGNDAEAVELLRDELAIAKAMDESASSMLQPLVATGLSAMASETAGRLADTLTLVDSVASVSAGGPPIGTEDRRARSSAVRNRKPATTDQLRSLIDELLDERPFRDGEYRGFQLESATALASTDPAAVAMSLRLPEWEVRLLWPMVRRAQLTGVCRLQIDANAVAVGRLAMPRLDQPSPAAPPPEVRNLPLLIDLVQGTYQQMLLSPRASQAFFQGSTIRRATAILLAVHLYESDHRMALPKELSSLTPGYLRALPGDPMRLDGKGFGYQPAGRRPFIYSVGIDGVDDGGSIQLPPSYVFGAFPSGVWRAPDEPFFIHWHSHE